jgi:hypothetical protein
LGAEMGFGEVDGVWVINLVEKEGELRYMSFSNDIIEVE